MESFEEHRNLNSILADTISSATRLLENYYDLAGNNKLDAENQEKCKEMAAELKAHTLALQDMMGKKTISDKDTEDKSGDKTEDDFLSELMGDLPKMPKKNIKVVKIRGVRA